MFKHLLATTSGSINWMALFALITFFLIFSIVLFQVFFQKKKYVDYMANLPFEKDQQLDNNSSGTKQ
mgnify:CR=1|jgi:cbb3-type cytochrome oxidase subunit 3